MTPSEIILLRHAFVASVLMVLTGPVLAQDEGGLGASLSFEQGLVLSSDDGNYGETNLAFDLSSVTRSETFKFSIGGSIEERFENDADIAFTDPSLALSYAIGNRQSAFSAALTYKEQDADSFVELTSGAPGVLVLDEGTREDLSATLGYSFGQEAPFGGSVTLGYGQTQFRGTSDPELVDSDALSFGVNLLFIIDPRIAVTTSYEIDETDRNVGRDVRTQNFDVGAEFEVTKTLTADVTVGLDRVTATSLGVETLNEGLGYSLNLTQARPLGTLTFDFESELSEAGREVTAAIGGSIEARDIVLSGRVGLTEGPDSEIRPLLELSYNNTLPNGVLSVDLDQRFAANTTGDATLNSRLRFGWQQELTSTSRFGSDLTYQITDKLGADEDTSRLELGLSYSHELTENWGLTTRYTHSIFERDTAVNTRTNEVFVGLETVVGWRP